MLLKRKFTDNIFNLVISIGVSDLDECTLSMNNCDDLAICTNTAGSFTCSCIDGYTGTGQSGNCVGELSQCRLRSNLKTLTKHLIH